MPATLTASPVRGTVTVPGTAELEFTVGGAGSRKLDVVVLYTTPDAGVRIASGASSMRTIGGRNATVRQALGFERTDAPTPGAFRVKAVVMEDGKAMGECTWSLQVHSTAAEQAMKAMANVAPDAPYVPLPDDDELAVLAERADRSAARKKAAAKKGATRKAATKKAGAKKSTAKKAAAKKAGAKKTTAKKAGAKKSTAKKAAGRKTTARKAAAKKSTAKKATAKKAGARKTGAKKAATKRPAAKKGATRKSAGRKAAARTRRRA